MNTKQYRTNLITCTSLAAIAITASSALASNKNLETGACCLEDPDTGQLICQIVTQHVCMDYNGYYYGDNTTCSDPFVECPEPIQDGACCVPQDDGSLACFILSAADCEIQSGYYYGDGTDCSDPFVECDPLQNERGACCYEDADLGMICAMLYENVCLDLGGFWYGPNVPCTAPQIECENQGTGECEIYEASNCAGRPNYADPDFANVFGDGRVAVETSAPNIFGGQVVKVFDLTNINSAPDDNWFALNRYSDPDWTSQNLGSIFGLAVDGDGNIFVTATKSWNNDWVSSGGWGAVYRLDHLTGDITLFAALPNQGASLGNITWDCDNNQFFVSNMEDGLVYRLDASGNVLDTFDHGTPWNGTAGPAALGDRVWAVEVHGNRLYYSVWNEDRQNKSASEANEIWSVALDATGQPSGLERLEVAIPGYFSGEQTEYSSPVSDIRFTHYGSMLVAERSMNSWTDITAHDARALEFECHDGAWVTDVNRFHVGMGNGTNASGGIDAIPEQLYASGDALHLAFNDNIYGFQVLPMTGGNVTNSKIVDYQDNLSQQDKTQLGDLVVTNEAEHCFVPWAMDTECILDVNGSGYVELTFGFSHDGNQPIDSISIQSLDGYTMTPNVFAGPFDPQHSFAFESDIHGSSANESACFEVTFTVAHEETCTAIFCVELPACYEPCPGDVNADMVVDISDLLAVLSLWGEECDGCSADIDGSGLVDVGDLLGVIANWGTACG